MGKVVAGGTVSLDGFIAGPNNSGWEHLFAWFNHEGGRKFPSVDPTFNIYLSEPDYQFMFDLNEKTGVNVIGRRMFDQVDGFGGRHPFDKPQVVVTHTVPDAWVAAHPDAPFTFATDGVAAAIETARRIAGDLNVDVQAGTLTTQCLELGLIDELWLDLVPVLLGGGVRFFDEIKSAPILLDGPNLVVEGSRVTHLRYEVRRA